MLKKTQAVADNFSKLHEAVYKKIDAYLERLKPNDLSSNYLFDEERDQIWSECFYLNDLIKNLQPVVSDAQKLQLHQLKTKLEKVFALLNPKECEQKEESDASNSNDPPEAKTPQLQSITSNPSTTTATTSTSKPQPVAKNHGKRDGMVSDFGSGSGLSWF